MLRSIPRPLAGALLASLFVAVTAGCRTFDYSTSDLDRERREWEQTPEYYRERVDRTNGDDVRLNEIKKEWERGRGQPPGGAGVPP